LFFGSGGDERRGGKYFGEEGAMLDKAKRRDLNDSDSSLKGREEGHLGKWLSIGSGYRIVKRL